MQRRRVMVSGLGAVTALGPDAGSFWERVREGRVAIRPVRHLNMDGLMTRIAGEVEAVPRPSRNYDRPDGYADRAFEFALQAAEEAVAAAGPTVEAVPVHRWGVVLGTCNAGLLSAREWYLRRREGGDPSPRLAAQSTPQAIAEMLAGAFGVGGPVLSVDTACAAGANALGLAGHLIRAGRADVVLAGGTDALSDVLVSGFNALESLSPVPAAPYTADRQGLSLGEGAGMLLLVHADLADELGLPVLAELAGYGLSADGYRPTAPHPQGLGAARAIRAALHDAGVSPSEVDYVNSHGTGTAMNDPAETSATKVGLGESDARRVAVSSTKSMIGHLLGGAGAVEALITVRALQEQIAPPTANFTTPDPECDLDYVPNTARPLKIDVALSNNFAFGGANASVVLRRPGYDDRTPEPHWDDVVVTGIGALTSAGLDPAALVEAIDAGRSCWQESEGRRIGRVDFKASDFLAPKERKRVDRQGLLSIIATRMALEAADLVVDDGNRERIGVVLGTGIGPMESMEAFAVPVIDRGPGAANPAVFPNTVYNAAAGQVAMKLGVLGPSSTVCAGHAAAAQALTYASDLARNDQADVMVALGADVMTETVAAAYEDLGLLGPGGMALGEAGVALVLERATHAAARDAAPLGRIAGYGIACDGLGVGRWDPDGNGVARAIRDALDDARVDPTAIVAIYTGNAGLASAEHAEEAGLDRVFTGEGPSRHHPLRLLGDPIGAGAAVASALAMTRGLDGPTLVTSSSLGGTHFAVVLDRADA